jgi:GNAT superfamily N-acetyltransferase
VSIPGVDRARLMLRRDGALGAARRVARRAGSYAALSEDHLWFVLDADAQRPRPPLAPGLTLIRPASSDLQLLEQLTTVVPRTARARIDAGNDLWLVLEGDRMLLNMWVFRDRTPTIAVPGGLLALPSDTVCLEDVEAVPAARGKGIAPAAYAAIADAMLAEGKRWIVNKTTVENESAQRAVQKAGFEAVAQMHFRRRGRRSRTWLELLDGPGASFFAECVGPGLTAGHAPR